jgi:hypothetical protein
MIRREREQLLGANVDRFCRAGAVGCGRIKPLNDELEGLTDDLAEDLSLVAKVQVEGPGGDPRFARNPVARDNVEPVAREQGRGGLEQQLSGDGSRLRRQRDPFGARGARF